MAPTSQKMEPTLGVKFLSAGMAGCVGDIITFPLDVAKVRLQVQGEGTSKPVAKISHLGGKPSMLAEAAKLPKYRGMMGTMLTKHRPKCNRLRS